MLTRCKAICHQVIQYNTGMWGYVFHPVTGGSTENEQFFKWTPSGKFEFGVTEEKKFEVGKTYYVDFTLAD